VAVGGTAVGVAVGGTAVGVAVGCNAVGVAVGGTAVGVAVGVRVDVGVLVGAGRVGTGVWVAVGVGVGVTTVIPVTLMTSQLHFDGEPGKAPPAGCGESGPVQSELSAFCFQLVQVETSAMPSPLVSWHSIVIGWESGNVPAPTFVTSPQPSLSRFANGQDVEAGSQPADEHGTVLIEHEPVRASPPSLAM
jgi:hypothetical protein